jgi:hypothetical protein
VVWFALNEDRPLFAFAGIWTTFNGDRGTKLKRSEAGAACVRDAGVEPGPPQRPLGTSIITPGPQLTPTDSIGILNAP